MKISKILAPILGLPLVLSAGLTTLVSCKNDDKEDDVNAFVTDPWSVVVENANQGLDHLKKHYELNSFVGLERTVTIYGAEHKVRVIGENEDYLADAEGKPDITKPVALTFQFANIVSGMGEEAIVPFLLQFIEFNLPVATWGGSVLRSFMRGEGQYESISVYHELNQQLGDNAIKKVVKYSMAQPKSAVALGETVFLPGIADIFNTTQIEEHVSEDYVLEAQLGDGTYHEPYSYYRNAINQDDEDAPKDRQKVLALTDPAGFYEPYWLRTACVDDWDIVEEKPAMTLNISWDGKWSKSDCVTGLYIAPIFCI